MALLQTFKCRTCGKEKSEIVDGIGVCRIWPSQSIPENMGKCNMNLTYSPNVVLIGS